MLIASSGDAETAAVEDAAKKWAEETGNNVKVTVASDMNQELAQGFAGGNPPDIFYLDAGQFADYARTAASTPTATRSRTPTTSTPRCATRSPTRTSSYCAPKDFSTLALQINTDAWEKAGLTDADIPTNWDQLATVAEKLTTGDQVGLGLRPGIDRLGAFVVGNGGWWLNDDATEATGSDPAVVDALNYVQDNLEEGTSRSPASSTPAGVARPSAPARRR